MGYDRLVPSQFDIAFRNIMKTSDFDYNLPPELIAQTPVEPRDSSRLMVVNRKDGTIHHGHFRDITEVLHPGDVLVFNDSRVIPARLHGKKRITGGKVEILLLRRSGDGVWQALFGPGKGIKAGSIVDVTVGDGCPALTAEVVGVAEGGVKLVRFSDETLIYRVGEMPLPPYIRQPLSDPERYQTVYARDRGSVAAPTAGLHFTPGMLEKIKQKGVICLFVTLHVGLDTFRPVTEEDPLAHPVFFEYGVISSEAAREVVQAKKEGRRVVSVGTTTTRLLEHAAGKSAGDVLGPFSGWVDLLILPGYKFRVTDVLLTNFHLPKSTLLMLVSAFAGLDLIKKAYSAAIEEKYRFYSFGDAMLIL